MPTWTFRRPTVLYDTELRAHLKSTEEAVAANVERLQPPPKFGFVFETAQQTMTGMQVLKLMVKTLDEFEWKRSPGQRELHRYMLMAHTRLIFGDSFPDHLDQLYDFFSVKKLRQEVFAMLARREGKTVGASMHTVAATRAIPHMETSIYAPSQRQSSLFMESVLKFLHQIDGMSESLIRNNASTLWVQGPCGKSDVRKVNCYPCNVSY